MVLYLKHRPKTLDQLIGQQEIVDYLKSTHRSGQMPHAYLFSGPRGTGKTSTARILASMVGASDMDVIEIDGASNRGVDDIRTLREGVALTAAGAGKKVYIIDEVHMLTPEAFNALLKTLEEPPSHVMFILATTEPKKLPETILSRTTHLQFQPASLEELIKAISNVAKAESIDIDAATIKTIAMMARGSFRDGLKYLDQVSKLKIINSETVTKLLGVSDQVLRFNLIESIGQGDPKKAIQIIANIQHVKDLILSTIEDLRKIYFIKIGLNQLVDTDLDNLDKFYQLEKIFDIPKLLFTIESFTQSLETIKILDNQLIALEMAILKSIAYQPQPRFKQEDLASNKTIKGSTSIVKEKSEISNTSLGTITNDQTIQSVNNDQADQSVSHDQIQTSISNQQIKLLSDKWNYVLETIRSSNFSLEALLRQTKIADCTESEVIVEVPYAFHQRIIEGPKSKELIEGVLVDVLGRQVRVTTVVGERPVRDTDISNIELAADDEVLRMAAEIFSSEVN